MKRDNILLQDFEIISLEDMKTIVGGDGEGPGGGSDNDDTGEEYP